MVNNFENVDQLVNHVLDKGWSQEMEETVFIYLRQLEEEKDGDACERIARLVFGQTHSKSIPLREENYTTWRNICNKCDVQPWKNPSDVSAAM